MNRKRALITGITGQDGSFLAEHLVALDYEVYGLVRVSSSRNRYENLERIIHDPRLHLLQGDLQDFASMELAIRRARPDEIYHLGALSYVPDSWKYPIYALDVNLVGTARILEASRNFAPCARIYQASTSEMFGISKITPQNEFTPFQANSPYAAAKVAAHFLAQSYREQHRMYVACGILFSHKSPRCGEQFLIKRIPLHAVKIVMGITEEKLLVRNLDSRCDWGWAPEYVPLMHRILLQREPEDWVIGQGRSFTVRDLLEKTFRALNLDWQEWVEVVANSEELIATPTNLIADPTKARKRLDWRPKVELEDMVGRMLEWAHSCISK